MNLSRDRQLNAVSRDGDALLVGGCEKSFRRDDPLEEAIAAHPSRAMYATANRTTSPGNVKVD